jgi:hypothetical protein
MPWTGNQRRADQGLNLQGEDSRVVVVRSCKSEAEGLMSSYTSVPDFPWLEAGAPLEMHHALSLQNSCYALVWILRIPRDVSCKLTSAAWLCSCAMDSPSGMYPADDERDMIPEDGLKPSGDQSSARRSTARSVSLVDRMLLLNEVCCCIWSTSGGGNKSPLCSILDTLF